MAAVAQVEYIRIYGANPAIPPESDPETGVQVLGVDTMHIGTVDSPVEAGASPVPIPTGGENLSIIAALAMRIVQPADPVTTISNVYFFVSQANLNALGGQWDGIHIWTPAAAEDPDLLDPFVAFSGDVGAVDDYIQATRTLGAQGYLGDSLVDVYGVAREDILAYPNQGRLDLTGRGRANGSVSSFGQSALDCSRMMLLQYGVTTAAASGSKPNCVLSCRYDEVQ